MLAFDTNIEPSKAVEKMEDGLIFCRNSAGLSLISITGFVQS
jgi:hypothetical protein